jgi:exosortase
MLRALALALAAFAYRPLALSALQIPTAYQFESWLFRPSQLPLPLVLGLAGWLLWRRREHLGTAPHGWRYAAAAALAFAAAVSYGWALLTRTPDLLLVSLALGLLAFGSAAGGGARALRLPALALLLGVRIPAPLREEIVWWLQRATANATGALLAPIRADFLQEGVILRSGEHSFHVIDGCSGLQGIAILLLVALIVGELLALSSRWRALLCAIAPVLGYALNTARIAYIAASPHPEAYAGLQGDHTPQGLALLGAGTAALYGLGRVLHELTPRIGAARGAPVAGRDTAWWQATVAFAALSALSVALSPFAPRAGPFAPPDLVFPEARARWTSEPIAGDPFFIGPQAGARLLYRRYARAGDPQLTNVIDVFIGMDQEDSIDPSVLFSSKMRWPGPDWDLENQRRAQLWILGREADFAIAARKSRPERALIYTWKIRDDGLWGESGRSLLGLEASPFRRARKRAVVRLVAFAPFEEPLAIDRAKQRLDQFVTVFRGDLSDL